LHDATHVLTFQGIVEDIRRLPNDPDRQEVFRRFWANLYTQEYQDPMAG
jgi:hypothetical protein